jgi:hypothetical protein
MFPLQRVGFVMMAGLVAGVAHGQALDQRHVAAAPASSTVKPIFSDAAIAPDDQLDQSTAREDLSVGAQTQQVGTVSRSTVSGTVSNGAVGIAGNALENASGLTLVNANSGNNVAMNGSINVNITITPPQP